MKRGICRGGFTLLELAIAGGLAALLAAGVAVLATRATAAWRGADGRLRQTVRVEKGLQRLAQDVRNGIVTPELPFLGEREEMRFGRAEELTRLADVRYKLVRQASGRYSLVRESAPFPNPDNLPPETATVIPELASLSLQYGVRAGEEGSNAVVWVDSLGEGAQTGGIPKVVRVTLESVDARGRVTGVTRDLWAPSGAWVSAPGD